MQDQTATELKQQVQKKLVIAYSSITLVIIVLLMVMMPYRFYERDVLDARNKAKEISGLVKTGILSTMISTGESKDIRRVIADYSQQFNFKFRLIRSEFVEQQHGTKEDHQGKDQLIRDVLSTGKGQEDWLNNTTFRYVMPFISDERCQKCHEGLDGKTIPTGQVLGASEIVFDLSAVRENSIRFIIEVMFLITVSLISLGVALYFVVKNAIMDIL